MASLNTKQINEYSVFFSKLDLDKSGTVSVSELRKSPLSGIFKFKELDGDHDKQITLTEFLVAMAE
ncbi:hypothetical protein [Glaciimonas immobilis]|uniref:Ca2+-binding EF-hand superfamily protein n=1 Tax=Glaciimonas immobilis TaxID=728004 RepID=A0A840RY98_9BURK|nr:hypothetical protein HAV38_08205 [Glaciimonas immobilis]MBB5202088.1 Ca2+-binding EF-hand superfamily protein [Glaciimonas immobilis]